LRQTKEATERRNDGTGMQHEPPHSFRPSVIPSQFRWELMVDSEGQSGVQNMATDAALLAESNVTAQAFLRLYRFDPPCLSLGRNEPADQYDQAMIARLGLDVVRRPTGGRAVWHEDELTYAVAAPIALFGGLRKAYRAIHERLAAAIRSLGADATLAFHRPPPASTLLHHPASCFAIPAGGEVLVAGRKLIGSAQVRKGSAFLQHGSILLDGTQEIVSTVTRARRAVSGETTVSAVLGRPVTFEEVADAIVATWDLAPADTP
jgi:lipoate-protein ligase A